LDLLAARLTGDVDARKVKEAAESVLFPAKDMDPLEESLWDDGDSVPKEDIDLPPSEDSTAETVAESQEDAPGHGSFLLDEYRSRGKCDPSEQRVSACDSSKGSDPPDGASSIMEEVFIQTETSLQPQEQEKARKPRSPQKTSKKPKEAATPGDKKSQEVGKPISFRSNKVKQSPTLDTINNTGVDASLGQDALDMLSSVYKKGASDNVIDLTSLEHTVQGDGQEVINLCQVNEEALDLESIDVTSSDKKGLEPIEESDTSQAGEEVSETNESNKSDNDDIGETTDDDGVIDDDAVTVEVTDDDRTTDDDSGAVYEVIVEEEEDGVDEFDKAGNKVPTDPPILKKKVVLEEKQEKTQDGKDDEGDDPTIDISDLVSEFAENFRDVVRSLSEDFTDIIMGNRVTVTQTRITQAWEKDETRTIYVKWDKIDPDADEFKVEDKDDMSSLTGCFNGGASSSKNATAGFDLVEKKSLKTQEINQVRVKDDEAKTDLDELKKMAEAESYFMCGCFS